MIPLEKHKLKTAISHTVFLGFILAFLAWVIFGK